MVGSDHTEQEVSFMSERPEQVANVGPVPEFSISRFFHDAYDKGVVKAIEECPREAALTAAGVVVGATAAIYLTKGGALADMLAGVEGKAGQALKPATEALTDAGLPITPTTRLAAREAGLGISASKGWSGNPGTGALLHEGARLGADSPFQAFSKEAFRHVPFRGVSSDIRPATEALINGTLPITAQTRAAAAAGVGRGLSAWQPGAEIRGIGALLNEGAGLGAKSPFEDFSKEAFRHLPYRVVSSEIRPATDALVKGSLPITAETRAAAASADIGKMPVWQREPAIRFTLGVSK
jgi:hypothetical protein